MASYTLKRLVDPTQLGTAAATLFTASGKTLVRQIVLSNPTGADVAASISIVPSGGTAGVANRILGGVAVKANDSQVLDLWQVLEAGDRLSGSAGTGSAVVVTASGVGIS